MNMILHGIEAPNMIHTNTLAENLAGVQEKDRFHIFVAKRDALSTETQSLARLYERKLALEALKKSLLHQAFTRPTFAALD